MDWLLDELTSFVPPARTGDLEAYLRSQLALFLVAGTATCLAAYSDFHRLTLASFLKGLEVNFKPLLLIAEQGQFPVTISS